MSEQPDWGAVYRANVDAIRELTAGLSAEQLGLPVPSTPAWTVRQVVAHVAGVAADNLTGHTDGAPGEDWTAHQVTERAGRDLADVLAELSGNADGVAAGLGDTIGLACVWDLAVHYADLCETLGAVADQSLWLDALTTVAAMKLKRSPVTVRTPDGDLGSGDTVIGASRYELFRALFSRRSRAQLATWPVLEPGDLDTDGLAAALDDLPVFGPRDDDVPAPTHSVPTS